MKILIVSPYLPHPLSGHGTGAFMYGLLRELLHEHEITLVSFCDRRELELAQDLKKLPMKFYPVPRGKGGQKNLWWNFYLVATRLLQFVRSVLLWQPYYVSKFYHPRMATLIEKLTLESQYDIVQFEMVQMAQYFGSSRSGKRILQAHDVAFRPAYRRYKSSQSIFGRGLLFVEWCRWVSFERNAAARFDHILCVTEQDRMLLEWLTSAGRVSYLPRGVDVAGQIPPYGGRESQSLLFVGTFSHRPNREAAFWLVAEIFPLVLQRHPESKLYIIGSNPPSELRQMAATTPRIEVLGFVDDVVGYLRKASVFIAPLRSGGGVKVKILHAMGQGIPVVTTKVGIEGIEGMNDETALVGDTAKRLADHICTLFEDRSRADLMGRKGWEAMRNGYSWERVVGRLDEIYRNVGAGITQEKEKL
jgi:glycosyltransferase involved in cell wall biosynthesis